MNSIDDISPADLHQLLQTYHRLFPQEHAQTERFFQWVQEAEDRHNEPSIWLRSTMQGHVCTSALVMDTQFSSVLMVHHAQVNAWLPPGGHYRDHAQDPIESFVDSGLRETLEETGIHAEPHPWTIAHGDVPLDLGIHPAVAIPHRNEIAHTHFDLRYLCIADKKQPIIKEKGGAVLDVRWVPLPEFAAFTDIRIQRIAQKLQRIRHHQL